MKRVAAFVAVQFVFAAVAWLGGFDFDHRGPGVAYGFFCAVVFGALLANFPALGSKT